MCVNPAGLGTRVLSQFPAAPRNASMGMPQNGYATVLMGTPQNGYATEWVSHRMGMPQNGYAMEWVRHGSCAVDNEQLGTKQQH